MTKNGSMKMSGGGNKSQGLPATTNKKTGSLIRHIMKEAYSNPKQRSGGSKEQQKQKTPSFSYEVSNLSAYFASSQPNDYVANNNSLTPLSSIDLDKNARLDPWYLSSSAFIHGRLRLVIKFTLDKDLTKSNGGEIKIDVTRNGTPLPFFADIFDPNPPEAYPSYWPTITKYSFYFSDGTGNEITSNLQLSLGKITPDANGWRESPTLVIKLKNSANVDIVNGNCIFVLSYNNSPSVFGLPRTSTGGGRYLGLNGPYQFFSSEAASVGDYDFSITSAKNVNSAGITVT